MSVSICTFVHPFPHSDEYLQYSQSRALGGTVGLAQCGAVLNAKVNSHISSLIASGSLSSSDAQALTQAMSEGLTSLSSINSLPSNVQSAVRGAYQQGSRWSFISLIPWAALAFIVTLFLSKIPDTDRGDAYEMQVDAPSRDTQQIPKSAPAQSLQSAAAMPDV